MEFLERMAVDSYGEQWLVREGAELRTAHVFLDDDRDELAQIANGTRRWLGLSHGSLTPVHAIEHRGARLVIVTGDERGRPFLQASRTLTDPFERERWAVAELCQIGDAITAMAAREPRFIHRRASNDEIVVGPDGRTRLRAPIEHVAVGPRPGYLGRARHTASARWMSPEQVLGVELTPASDVYQLAFMLHCALLGAYPYKAAGDFELLLAIRDGAGALPPPPMATLGLRDVLHRSLAREPSARPASVAELVRELRRLVPDEPVEIRARLAAEPPHAPPGRSPAIAGYRCHLRWSDLAATEVSGVRHCGECQHDVVQVRSIEALIPLLGKRCVAVTEE